MALRWMDGFESARTSANMSRRYNGQVDGFLNLAAWGTGRLQGFCITATGNNHYGITPTFANHATWIVGMAFRHVSVPSNDQILMEFRDGNNVNCSLTVRQGTVNTTYVRFRLMVGGTQVAISAEYPPGASTFYYLELKTTSHLSSGSYSFKVNEIVEFSGSGVATAQFSAVCNNIKIGCPSSSLGCSIDDVYVCDGSGSIRNDFLGDCVVETILPDSDVTTGFPNLLGAGTTHWDKVDDPSNVAYDDDTTAVVSTADAQKDLYGFAALAFLQSNFLGVQVEIQARLASSGSRVYHARFRHSDTTEISGPAITLTSTSYTPPSFTIWEQRPTGTPADWTLAEINAGSFGILTG